MPAYRIDNPACATIEELTALQPPGGLKLDLGCGRMKRPGYIGLDNYIGADSQVLQTGGGPDICIDLDRAALPFADNSCVEVYTSHFLEHSSNVDHVVNEAHRVLRQDGQFIVIVPYANSAEGMYAGHSVFYTEKWFHANINFQDKFHIAEEIYFPSDYYQQLPFLIRLLLPFSFARKFLYNACWQMELRCRPKKP